MDLLGLSRPGLAGRGRRGIVMSSFEMLGIAGKAMICMAFIGID